MTWSLFLDDVRKPNQVIYPRDIAYLTIGMRIARSYDEAIGMVEAYGCPQFISFDHDLAEEHYSGDWSKHAAWQNSRGTGYHFAQWLIYKDLDQKGKFFPDNFKFFVHSMNPVGAQNIRELFNSYFQYKAGA